MEYKKKIASEYLTDLPIVFEISTSIHGHFFHLAEEELANFQKLRAEPGCAWGFFQEICDKVEYSCSVALSRQLVSHDELSGLRFNFLSFSRYRVTASFGGFHLDTLPDLSGHEELVRCILNLSDSSKRTIEFSNSTRIALLREGLKISKTQYEALNYLNDRETFSVRIPARRNEKISGAIFVSSLWPHKGVTNDEGHFIAGFDMRIGSVS